MERGSFIGIGILAAMVASSAAAGYGASREIAPPTSTPEYKYQPPSPWRQARILAEEFGEDGEVQTLQELQRVIADSNIKVMKADYDLHRITTTNTSFPIAAGVLSGLVVLVSEYLAVNWTFRRISRRPTNLQLPQV